MTTTTESSNPRFAEGVQYRQRVEQLFREAREKHATNLGDGFSSMRMSNYPKPERPQDGHAWGPWVYQKENLTLQFAPRDGHWSYEIDLEQCVSSAQILDKIFQLRTKREDLVSAEDIGHLVAALDDLLHPQANVCSFGQDARFDPATYLTEGASDRKIDLEGHVREMLESGRIKITTFEAKQ